jgi:MFS family permease
MSSNWLGLSSFGLGAAGMFATVYCTQAILPTLGREFGVSAAQTGLTISVVVVAMAAGAWIWGPLSDTIGRKRCLVLSSGLRRQPRVGAVKRIELGHVGLDSLHPLVAGDADTMIAVLDEIRVANLV